ncbi:MAG: tRNA (adenosine(37)-N6)-threonylcarbamoyltransferase complex transferase subunit TsaD [Rhodospirillales bacterium]
MARTGPLILGIETSCDETAAAVVDGSKPAAERVLGHVVLSQTDAHRVFGGVVPEVAARAHLEATDGVIRETLAEAGVTLADLDAVAATAGPGLIGGVMVGLTSAKSLALVAGKPLIAVNHLEAHALTVRLTQDVPFPYLLLLVSGGHCQLLIVEGVGQYRRLGTTLDDALGEAFDKSAKILGLGYPGGPAVERLAQEGDDRRFDLPRPMLGKPGCDFSFSGLKTAVRQAAEALPPGPFQRQDLADLCASFQRAAGETLADRTKRAVARFREVWPQGGHLVVAGGVAANKALNQRLAVLAAEQGLRLAAPPLSLCTDNGAMIAWAGVERFRLGLTDSLDFRPRPRWPLDPKAPKAAYAGVKA